MGVKMLMPQMRNAAAINITGGLANQQKVSAQILNVALN
jgi:hypothetical protein